MNEIINVVSEYYGISSEQLFSKSRKGNVVKARFICFFLIRKNLQWSLQKIAKTFNKNHASILHGIQDVEFRMEAYEDDREDIRNIWMNLKYALDTTVDFSQSIYREIINDSINIDFNVFVKLNLNENQRKWIYRDLKIERDIINKIEERHGIKKVERGKRPQERKR